VNRSCNAPASADSLGYRVGHITMVAPLLMGLGLMCILMVNVPGSRAMAAAPDGSESQQESSVERIAARSTQEPGDTTVKPRRRSAGVQVASLGPDKQPSLSDAPSVGGGAVRWTASSACLNATLRRIVGEVAAAYGPVTVNSTCRNPSRNAAVGGARHSYHLSGSATDFRIHGNARAVHAYLSSNRSVGGLKHYGGGLFHIDVGPRRTW
jgi:peptidase M15-like protein